MSLSVKDITRIFEKQAEKNAQYHIEKELFLLGLELNLEDWRKIRTKKYWEKRDVIDNQYRQKKFTVFAIREYLDFEK